jgi:hypothetical protein
LISPEPPERKSRNVLREIFRQRSDTPCFTAGGAHDQLALRDRSFATP